MPVTSVNSVTFGSGSDCNAGRVVSAKGYKNITQIRATVDLSKLTSNFVVSTFYMVSNPTNPGLQPKGTNYCDAGGTHNEWNCQEIDFFEANKNVVLQHTMHLGDGGSHDLLDCSLVGVGFACNLLDQFGEGHVSGFRLLHHFASFHDHPA